MHHDIFDAVFRCFDQSAVQRNRASVLLTAAPAGYHVPNPQFRHRYAVAGKPFGGLLHNFREYAAALLVQPGIQQILFPVIIIRSPHMDKNINAIRGDIFRLVLHDLYAQVPAEQRHILAADILHFICRHFLCSKLLLRTLNILGFR